MFVVASFETYRDGQIIFEENSFGDWLYVIESGAVELYKTVDGRSVPIEILREGDVFGELAFIAKIPRTASARAMGDVTLGILDRTYLDEEFNKLSGNFRELLKGMVTRLKHATDAVVRAKFRPPAGPGDGA